VKLYESHPPTMLVLTVIFEVFVALLAGALYIAHHW
jgi:hypothetical protein